MLQVGVVGVNYKTASLKLRENLARKLAEHTQLEALFSFPFVVLTTCNRFEIYFSSNDLYSSSHTIVKVLESFIKDSGRAPFYHYFDHTCFYHLAKVISGLDSAILGESDIQRQVKKSYISSHLKRKLSKDLHYLFQKSLRIGKKLRTHTLRPHKFKSLEKLILEKVRPFAQEPILFVGYSDINRKIMAYLKQHGIDQLTLCTRAHLSQEQINMKQIPFDKIEQWIHYRAVIVGTKYGEYLLKEKQSYLKNVQTRLIFDLGIPRNVEPLISEIETIELLDLEMVADEIEKERKISQQELKRAENEICQLTHQYEQIFWNREMSKTRMLVGL